MRTVIVVHGHFGPHAALMGHYIVAPDDDAEAHSSSKVVLRAVRAAAVAEPSALECVADANRVRWELTVPAKDSTIQRVVIRSAHALAVADAEASLAPLIGATRRPLRWEYKAADGVWITDAALCVEHHHDATQATRVEPCGASTKEVVVVEEEEAPKRRCAHLKQKCGGGGAAEETIDVSSDARVPPQGVCALFSGASAVEGLMFIAGTLLFFVNGSAGPLVFYALAEYVRFARSSL